MSRQHAPVRSTQKRHRNVQTQKSHRLLHKFPHHKPPKSCKHKPREHVFHPSPPLSPTRSLRTCSKSQPSSPTETTFSSSIQFPDDKVLPHPASGAGLSDGDVSDDDDDDDDDHVSHNHDDCTLEMAFCCTTARIDVPEALLNIDDVRCFSPSTQEDKSSSESCPPCSADATVTLGTPLASELAFASTDGNIQAEVNIPLPPPQYMDRNLMVLKQHLPALVESGVVAKCRAAGTMHLTIMYARSIRKAPTFHSYDTLMSSKVFRDAAFDDEYPPQDIYDSCFAPKQWQPSGRSRQGCCLPYHANVVGSPKENSFILYCIVKQYATNEWLTQAATVDPAQLLNACIDFIYPRYNRPRVLGYEPIWRLVAGKGHFPLGTLRLWIQFPLDCDPDLFLSSMSGAFLMDRSGVWFDPSGTSLRAISDAYTSTKSQDLRHALTDGLPTGPMVFERGMGPFTYP